MLLALLFTALPQTRLPLEPPSAARVEVREGRAVLAVEGGTRELRPGEPVQRVPGPAHLEATGSARVALRWPYLGSLESSGPAVIEWRPVDPADASGQAAVEWNLLQFDELHLEGRGPAVLVRLPGGWSAELRGGAAYLARRPNGSLELHHDAGLPLLLRPPESEGSVRPPFTVLAGARLRLEPGSIVPLERVGTSRRVLSPFSGARGPDGEVPTDAGTWTHFTWPWPAAASTVRPGDVVRAGPVESGPRVAATRGPGGAAAPVEVDPPVATGTGPRATAGPRVPDATPTAEPRAEAAPLAGSTDALPDPEPISWSERPPRTRPPAGAFSSTGSTGSTRPSGPSGPSGPSNPSAEARLPRPAPGPSGEAVSGASREPSASLSAPRTGVRSTAGTPAPTRLGPSHEPLEPIDLGPIREPPVRESVLPRLPTRRSAAPALPLAEPAPLNLQPDRPAPQPDPGGSPITLGPGAAGTSGQASPVALPPGLAPVLRPEPPFSPSIRRSGRLYLSPWGARWVE